MTQVHYPGYGLPISTAQPLGAVLKGANVAGSSGVLLSTKREAVCGIGEMCKDVGIELVTSGTSVGAYLRVSPVVVV